MTPRKHIVMLLQAVSVWFGFWLIGLPNCYQQYSTVTMAVASILLSVATSLAAIFVLPGGLDETRMLECGCTPGSERQPRASQPMTAAVPQPEMALQNKEAGGFPAISRWLREGRATPPVGVPELPHPGRGARQQTIRGARVDGSGLQPLGFVGGLTWGIAPGWDGAGLWPLVCGNPNLIGPEPRLVYQKARGVSGVMSIIGVCKLIKLGKSLAVGEVSLYSEGSQALVAHAVGTYAIAKRQTA